MSSYEASRRKPEIIITSGAFKFILPNRRGTPVNTVKEDVASYVEAERGNIVCSILSDHLPHARLEIEKALGTSTSTTRRILQKLIDEGKISSTGTTKNVMYFAK